MKQKNGISHLYRNKYWKYIFLLASLFLVWGIQTTYQMITENKPYPPGAILVMILLNLFSLSLIVISLMRFSRSRQISDEDREDVHQYHKLFSNKNEIVEQTPPENSYLEIHSTANGYIIKSLYRPLFPLYVETVISLVAVGIGGFNLYLFQFTGMKSSYNNYMDIAVILVLFLFAIFSFSLGIHISFGKKQIAIDTQGVTIRRKNIPLDSIEDVVLENNGRRIRILGNQNTLSIHSYFVPSDQRSYLLYEIRRLILDVARKNGI